MVRAITVLLLVLVLETYGVVALRDYWEDRDFHCLNHTCPHLADSWFFKSHGTDPHQAWCNRREAYGINCWEIGYDAKEVFLPNEIRMAYWIAKLKHGNIVIADPGPD